MLDLPTVTCMSTRSQETNITSNIILNNKDVGKRTGQTTTRIHHRESHSNVLLFTKKAIMCIPYCVLKSSIIALNCNHYCIGNRIKILAKTHPQVLLHIKYKKSLTCPTTCFYPIISPL